eukprot:981628-Pelagomonas_calceolata.AAC.3
MSGQERPNCLASLSPQKALTLDSLPHHTPLLGAVAGGILPACWHARPVFKAAAGEEEGY